MKCIIIVFAVVCNLKGSGKKKKSKAHLGMKCGPSKKVHKFELKSTKSKNTQSPMPSHKLKASHLHTTSHKNLNT